MSEQLNFTVYENGHSILSPSGWSTWSTCTGSMIGLNESRKVATDNLPSVEGTTAHTLLEICLLVWVCPSEVSLAHMNSLPKHIIDEIKTSVIKWRDNIVNNINNKPEVKLFAEQCFEQIMSGNFTAEMRNEIKKCYDRIKAFKDDGWVILPESRVSLYAYFGHNHSDGSSDVIMYKGNRLIVVDLKYGKGVEVDPDHNGQLSLYGGGALAAVYAKTGVVFEEIELVIMQPRINNGVWKVWPTTYSGENGLYNFLQLAKVKSEKAIVALQGGAHHYEPSDKGCMWCHKRKDCKPRGEHASNLVRKAFELAGVVKYSDERPHDISNENIADILDITPFVVSFLKDMGEVAEKRAKNGELIPRRKLVAGRSARNWTDEEAVLLGLSDSGLFPDQYVNVALKSPAQMDKVLLNQEQKDIVKKFIAKSFGGESLVSVSDRRPAVIKNAAQAFEAAGVVQLNHVKENS